MLGKIINIIDNKVVLKLSIDPKTTQNLLNLYVLIKDNQNSFIGEIVSIKEDEASITLIGEYINNELNFGIIQKPALSAKVDLINPSYIEQLLNYKEGRSFKIATSPFYNGVPVKAKINSLFGSHLAVFGSTGSGKSCSYAKIIQNILKEENLSNKMNLVIFDAYGEYANAFEYLNQTPNRGFKMFTTQINGNKELISIPPWFLDADDYALLLQVTKKYQISIIEKALRNVSLFKKNETDVITYKNSIIANALLDILLSGRPAAQIRDLFLSALSKFHTKDLNLESTIYQPGYSRTLRQCLLIDDNNKINAIEQIAEFLQKFLIEDVYSSMPDGSFPYTLEDFSNGLEFALIDEGIWKSDRIFDDANILKVRLNSLLNSDTKEYFQTEQFKNIHNPNIAISKQEYINYLFSVNGTQKAQIVNFNISYVDDRFAKIIVKIFSKLFFNFAKELDNRGSIPFNLILEEAHRYVQHDSDIELIGYNIFERIAKEGRKYGVLINLISQRPCELSET